MKNAVILLIIGLMAVACNRAPKQADSQKESQQTSIGTEPVRDGVFIHITEGYKDPHRVLMPLKMAVMMAQDKDVIVYMDINTVELLVKNSKDMKYADFDSFQSYIRQLAALNVGVYACPTCLKVKGLKESDLMAGVQVAEKDKFFNFTKGRILTMNY